MKTPLEVGAVVSILTRHFGFWSLNACRVVYLIDQVRTCEEVWLCLRNLIEPRGRGEERFTIEWHKADDTVW